MSGIAAAARRLLWRTLLTVTGGLRVVGRPPSEPCVIVANHNSHADTAALIAALSPRRRPVVAAAADYWFGRPGRSLVCRALCAAFPVRRGGGGGDLAAAVRLLAAGHDVIVFPEGTRSRDGSVGPFHTGAVRLARAAGTTVVPAWIDGTQRLLPVHGTPRPARVTVRFGTPIPADDVPELIDRVRTAVLATSNMDDTIRPVIRDSQLRQRVSALAMAPVGVVIVACWAFAESLSFPLIPEAALAVACVAAPRGGLRLLLTAAAASVLGGVAGYLLAAHGIALPEPLTTARMHQVVITQTMREGAAAVRHQPLSGIPFKVYAAQAGRDHVGLLAFARESLLARGIRIAGTGLALTAFGAAANRLRRYYSLWLIAFFFIFTTGLVAVVTLWALPEF